MGDDHLSGGQARLQQLPHLVDVGADPDLAPPLRGDEQQHLVGRDALVAQQVAGVGAHEDLPGGPLAVPLHAQHHLRDVAHDL